MRLQVHPTLSLDLSLRRRQDLSPYDDAVTALQGGVVDHRDVDELVSQFNTRVTVPTTFD